MRKIITLVLASAFVLGMFSMSSCSNKQELLHGKWSATQNEFEDSENGPVKHEYTRTYEFKDDGKLIDSWVIKVDGQTLATASINGTYQFHEKDLDENDKAIGMITPTYDLSTLKMEPGDVEISEADKAALLDTFEQTYKEMNRQAEKADKENESSLLQEKLYGFVVLSLDETDLVLDQNGEEVTYIKQ